MSLPSTQRDVPDAVCGLGQLGVTNSQVHLGSKLCILGEDMGKTLSIRWEGGEILSFSCFCCCGCSRQIRLGISDENIPCMLQQDVVPRAIPFAIQLTDN